MIEKRIDDLTVCVLISCMHQDKNIIERTHVQTNVVVINQCDKEEFEEWEYINNSGCLCHAKFISTKERGLSRSRNMAIKNAVGDICVISDDDEELVDGYESIIKDAYKLQPEADLISFAFERQDKSFSKDPAKHSVKTLLKTSSVEISFVLDSILEKQILFDEKMGSGTGNGAGEENMFLMTCKRKGLKMFYNPSTIGRLLSTDSQWFKGYNSTYFENYGWAERRILGGALSLLYFVYWVLAHHSIYNKGISSVQAIKYYLKGWCSKR